MLRNAIPYLVVLLWCIGHNGALYAVGFRDPFWVPAIWLIWSAGFIPVAIIGAVLSELCRKGDQTCLKDGWHKIAITVDGVQETIMYRSPEGSATIMADLKKQLDARRQIA